jgi:hypothetical protein
MSIIIKNTLLSAGTTAAIAGLDDLADVSLSAPTQSDVLKFNGIEWINSKLSYTELINTPALPTAQVNTDWNAVSGVEQLLNKPTTFPPTAHSHPISGVTGLQAALDATQPLDADLTAIAGLVGTTIVAAGAPLWIAGDAAGTGFRLNGYMDDLRITVGASRYLNTIPSQTGSITASY